MLMIDEMSYASPLRGISPKAKIVFGLLPLIICIVAQSFWVSGIAIVTMSASAALVTKLALKRYLKLLAIPFSFLIIGTITIVISRYPENTPLLLGITISRHIYGITLQSLESGLRIIATALGAVSCMYFITINTPMNDILTALRSMKVPSLLVSLMELIYRYIFVVLDEARRMRQAQESRLGYVTFRRSIRSCGELCGALFLRVFLRSDRMYAALESRGYDGEFKALAPEFSHAGKLVACAIGLNFLLLAVAVAEVIISNWQ